MYCPKCGVKSSNDQECSACGVLFSKYENSKSHSIERERKKQFESLNTEGSEARIELGMPVLAFAFSIIAVWLIPGIVWLVSMGIHEFGHAFAGWFGGVAATPFIGWTNYGNGRSWVVTICFATLLGLLGYKCWKNKTYFPILVLFGMFIAQIYFRFVLSKDELNCMMSYMGIGGEFWISTILIISYHYQFPEKMFWQLLRFPFLFAGALTFTSNFNLWWNVSHRKRDIPWGSMIGGENFGDMNSLVNEFAWTHKEIISSYLRLGSICLAVIVIHYCFQIIKTVLIKKKGSDTV